MLFLYRYMFRIIFPLLFQGYNYHSERLLKCSLQEDASTSESDFRYHKSQCHLDKDRASQRNKGNCSLCPLL